MPIIRRLQPAAGSDLFSATDLPASLERAAVFSMAATRRLRARRDDCPPDRRRLAADVRRQGAAAYAGTRLRIRRQHHGCVSEALNVRLARGLRDRLSIGEALVQAKQGHLVRWASWASTTRRRWPSSRSTVCRCGRWQVRRQPRPAASGRRHPSRDGSDPSRARWWTTIARSRPRRR